MGDLALAHPDHDREVLRRDRHAAAPRSTPVAEVDHDPVVPGIDQLKRLSCKAVEQVDQFLEIRSAGSTPEPLAPHRVPLNVVGPVVGERTYATTAQCPVGLRNNLQVLLRHRPPSIPAVLRGWEVLSRLAGYCLRSRRS